MSKDNEHLDFLLSQSRLYRRKLATVEYPARIRLILSRIQQEIEVELKLRGVLPLEDYQKKEKVKVKEERKPYLLRSQQ